MLQTESTQIMPQRELFSHIDCIYRPTLQHLNTRNQPIRILFSGSNCSGKTTLARIIEEKCRAVRFENDAVRRIIRNSRPTLSEYEISTLTYRFMNELFESLKDIPNQRWIMDASIDRYYHLAFKHCNQHGAPPFVISVESELEEIIHRLQIRDKIDADIASRTARKCAKDQALFLSVHTPDLVLQPGFDSEQAAQSILNHLKH